MLRDACGQQESCVGLKPAPVCGPHPLPSAIGWKVPTQVGYGGLSGNVASNPGGRGDKTVTLPG